MFSKSPANGDYIQMTTAATATKTAATYRSLNLLGCGAVIDDCCLAGSLDMLEYQLKEGAETLKERISDETSFQNLFQK